ncbi:MAG: elongator complex protein 3 [Syntrophothermus sp.]
MVKGVRAKKHYTIPVFIPHEACPFKCIFCDQEKITGKMNIPGGEEIQGTITRNLSTFSPGAEAEVGFFGGTFTGLSLSRQKSYLDLVLPFIEEGRISGIRLSTRPDYIDREKLSFLKQYPVRTIELGAQSFDEEVLKRSFRGHTASDTINASRMIVEYGFSLGLQMMVGLPGDSEEKVQNTAATIVSLGASEARIYPVLVIRGTALEKMYRSGEYQPLSLEDAVRWTAPAVEELERAGVKIIRIGLHSSDTLADHGYVAGPVHPSLRELVMTAIWKKRFSPLFNHAGDILIRVNPADLNNAVGYYGWNKKALQSHYNMVKFLADPEISLNTYHADHH